MRRMVPGAFTAILLAAMSAGAVDPAPDDEPLKPGITVTGEKPRPELPLPKIPPDQFSQCLAASTGGAGTWDVASATQCEIQLAAEERIVIDKCTDHDGKSEPAVRIQACNELLERQMLHGRDRAYLYLDRALAYLAEGDAPHALEDYDTAVKLAPGNPQPYYYRGVFHAAQSNFDAAMGDLGAALNLDPKLVPALLQRARVHVRQKDLAGALADYSEAIRLRPQSAATWSERGYVSLLQRDYETALQDEARAVELDPKLARAWYLRAAAYGDLGRSQEAVDDIKTAVGLDASLVRYIVTKGKTATLTLPPL